MKLTEVAREVIRLGGASRTYWDRELPKRHPNYPLVRPDEDSGPPPPEEEELRHLLGSLPEEQVYALIALMYAGLGDFDVRYVLPASQNMRKTFGSVDMAIAQMMGKRALAEYLEDALEDAEKRHVDLDSLDFAEAASVR